MTTITMSDKQRDYLRTGLQQNLIARTQNDGAELDSLTLRGWFSKLPLKIRRGNLKADYVYELTAAGRKAAEKLIGEAADGTLCDFTGR